MSNNLLVVGLDIGTTKVATIIAEIPGFMPPDGRLRAEVLGVGVAPSHGVQRGAIVDMNKTVDAIRQSRCAAEKMADAEIVSAVIGLTGDHIVSQNETGVAAVANQAIIGLHDVERALGSAKDVRLPEGREIIFAFPRSFSIDGQRGISDPVGMSGVRLEVETHIVTVGSSFRQNIENSALMAGIQPGAYVLEPVAAAEAVSTDAERQLGVILVDIGGGTTDIEVFLSGSPYFTAAVPVGGNLVTHDVAVGMRCAEQVAESLKVHDGTALPLTVEEGAEIDVRDADGVSVEPRRLRLLAEIIEARVEEIFELTRQALDRGGCISKVGAGMILTGGASQLRGTLEVARRIFPELSIRRGTVQHVTGRADLVSSPIYATAVGLVLRGARLMLEDTPGVGIATAGHSGVRGFLQRVLRRR